MTTEKFNKLSKKQKAVLVAKDVLAQLKCGKYTPKTASYIKIYDENFQPIEGSIKDNFDKVPQCHVCAIGATLLSATHLGNVLEFKDIDFNKGINENCSAFL